MIPAIANATCRFLRGLYGAVTMMREDGSIKDALSTFRLIDSPHTEGLTVANAIAIAQKASEHKIDPFDLWMVFDGYVCDDLDHAVIKVLEMKALYERPLRA